MQELDLGYIHICSRCTDWSVCRSPNNWSRACLWLSCLPMNILPLVRLPTQVSVREDALCPIGTRCPRMGWYPGGAFPSLSLSSVQEWAWGKHATSVTQEWGEHERSMRCTWGERAVSFAVAIFLFFFIFEWACCGKHVASMQWVCSGHYFPSLSLRGLTAVPSFLSSLSLNVFHFWSGFVLVSDIGTGFPCFSTREFSPQIHSLPNKSIGTRDWLPNAFSFLGYTI